MCENQYHPAVDHVFPVRALPPLPRHQSGGGGEIGGDVDSSCVCMPIKYWIFVLALVHIVLLVVSLSVQFYWIVETVLVVFSLLIVLLPDVFAHFVHFLIQLVLWILITAFHFFMFINECSNEANGTFIALWLIYFACSFTFTILYIRMVAAGR